MHLIFVFVSHLASFLVIFHTLFVACVLASIYLEFSILFFSSPLLLPFFHLGSRFWSLSANSDPFLSLVSAKGFAFGFLSFAPMTTECESREKKGSKKGLRKRWEGSFKRIEFCLRLNVFVSLMLQQLCSEDSLWFCPSSSHSRSSGTQNLFSNRSLQRFDFFFASEKSWLLC